MNARSLRSLSLLLAVALAAPVIVPIHRLAVAADAPDADTVKRARAAFEKGAAFAADSRWGDALEQFEQSAALVPHATTTYNIGYCERALGRSTRAKKSFSRALLQNAAHGGSELSAELKAACSKYIDEMSARIATPTLTIAPADATVTVDGAPLELADDGKRMLAGTRGPGAGEKIPGTVSKSTGSAVSFVMEVDAGDHQIAVVASDGRSKIVKAEFDAGSSSGLQIEVPVAVDTSGTKTTTSSRRTFGFILGGLGVVGLGVGTIFALTARSTWADARDACPDHAACPDDRGHSLSLRAKREGDGATIAFAAGGAAIVGGVILILTSPSGGKDRVIVSGSVDPKGGGFLLLRGAF